MCPIIAASRPCLNSTEHDAGYPVQDQRAEDERRRQRRDGRGAGRCPDEAWRRERWDPKHATWGARRSSPPSATEPCHQRHEEQAHDQFSVMSPYRHCRVDASKAESQKARIAGGRCRRKTSASIATRMVPTAAPARSAGSTTARAADAAFRSPSLDQRHSESYAFRQNQADENGDGKQDAVLEERQREDQRYRDVSRSPLTEDAASNEVHHIRKDGDDAKQSCHQQHAKAFQLSPVSRRLTWPLRVARVLRPPAAGRRHR